MLRNNYDTFTEAFQLPHTSQTAMRFFSWLSTNLLDSSLLTYTTTFLAMHPGTFPDMLKTLVRHPEGAMIDPCTASSPATLLPMDAELQFAFATTQSYIRRIHFASRTSPPLEYTADKETIVSNGIIPGRLS